MSKPKVSVGLCVKNSEKTVKEAIKGIINQNYPKALMELIVVDGVSKDKTLSIIASVISNADIPVRIYSDEGKGLGVARQIVVDDANGKYIIFVDGDVELLNDFVQKQVDFMEQNPQVGVAIGKYMYKGGTLIAALQNLYSCITEFVGNDATIFRVEALRQVEGYDKNIKGAFEDWDVIVRLRVRGWKLSINEKAKFYHNPRENWRALWVEQEWSGYGGHYFGHKHGNSFTLWHKFPLITFVGTLKVAVKAYKSLHQNKLFLMPFLFSFRTIPWWLGFMRSHIDGYGHETS